MTKPDGIPQDVWDAAGHCVKRLRLPELLDADFATQEEMDRLTLEIVGEDGLTIAHAIMAERRRCIEVVTDYRAFRGDTQGDIGVACLNILVAMEESDT